MHRSLYLFIFVFFITFTSCNEKKATNTTATITINETKLLNNLKILASDSLEGRGFSTPGNYKAQQFLAKQFKSVQLIPVIEKGYIQKFPYTFKGKTRERMFPLTRKTNSIPDTTVVGGNVIGMLKGKIDKTIIITAHLDHLGIRKGKIYNGADDDASGSAALVTIAEYFKAKKTNHTLLFAAVDAEEIGSLGADYLVNNFPTAIKDVVLNINMDMIAHNDKEIYACGLYHYPQLKEPLENIKSSIALLFGHDDPNHKKLDDWTNSSDHRIFHKKGIPFIYFGVEDHKDYHKDTDTFETINQEFYVEAVKLIIKAIENYDTYLE